MAKPAVPMSLVDRIAGALDAGYLDPKDLEELLATARQRRKLALVDYVKKVIDEGHTDDAIKGALESIRGSSDVAKP